MAEQEPIGRRMFGRALAALGLARAVPADGVAVHWPGGGSGLGDRGPPGSWQMGTNTGWHSPEALMAFSAVYTCVKIISEDVAKLPVQVFRIDADTGARQLQRNDYYAQLMRRPNDYQTGPDFMQLFMASYLYRGNAYAYTPRNGRGEVSEMHVLDPRAVQPYVEPETGAIFYRCGQNVLAGIKPGTMIPDRFMIHHRSPLLASYPLIGLTPIFAAAQAASVGIHILTSSQKLFSNQSRPGGVLTAPGRISKDTAQRLKDEWDTGYTGERYGKTAVLPEGLKWETMTMTAQDAELIAQLRFSVEEVGRAFRVPPFMLGDTTKTTYRNSEQLGRMYLTGCLGFHLEAVEQRFARAFEFPIDWELRFDLAALLRAEIDVRFTAYTQALNAGWMTPNEVRAGEGLEPKEGGDEPHLQMQYIPLSQSGKTLPPAGDAPGGSDNPAPADPSAPELTPTPGGEAGAAGEAGIDVEHVRRLLRQRITRRAA
jgi:HK97 family phage portal protein